MTTFADIYENKFPLVSLVNLEIVHVLLVLVKRINVDNLVSQGTIHIIFIRVVPVAA
jgi:hypothetical protein